MFIIVYETENHKQWNCDFSFDKYYDAVDYLEKQGFVNKKRIFEQSATNWHGKYTAYIQPLIPYIVG